MIIHRRWIDRRKGGLEKVTREGWFLFGFIPLYIRQLTMP